MRKTIVKGHPAHKVLQDGFLVIRVFNADDADEGTFWHVGASNLQTHVYCLTCLKPSSHEYMKRLADARDAIAVESHEEDMTLAGSQIMWAAFRTMIFLINIGQLNFIHSFRTRCYVLYSSIQQNS